MDEMTKWYVERTMPQRGGGIVVKINKNGEAEWVSPHPYEPARTVAIPKALMAACLVAAVALVAAATLTSEYYIGKWTKSGPVPPTTQVAPSAPRSAPNPP